MAAARSEAGTPKDHAAWLTPSRRRPCGRPREGIVSVGVRRGSRRCRRQVETREVHGRRSHKLGEDQEPALLAKRWPREAVREERSTFACHVCDKPRTRSPPRRFFSIGEHGSRGCGRSGPLPAVKCGRGDLDTAYPVAPFLCLFWSQCVK